MSENDLTDAAFDQALIAAAFNLAAAQGWNRMSLAEAARQAGLPLERARARFGDRNALLVRFGQLADQAALAEISSDVSVRDRLFDLLMRRIDAFQEHRFGVLALLRALPSDPAASLLLSCATRRSLGWMLDAAGVPTAGLAGHLRVCGLLAVWLWTIRAWQKDESRDLSATMAALDAALSRAEGLASWLDRPGSRSDPAPDIAAGPPSPTPPEPAF